MTPSSTDRTRPTPPTDAAALPRRLRLFLSQLHHVERGAIEVALPDGARFRAAGRDSGPQGKILVRHPQFFRRLLTAGHVGFGEMFMEGWWTTPDLQALMDVVLLNNENMARRFRASAPMQMWERVRHWLNANSRRGTRRNIAHHYDLGNDFYRLWLDETMTYSSALFRGEREPLSAAQRNKYAAICDRLALGDDKHILEIGCGWGGFAEYAIRERGLRVTGLTVSRAQRAWAQRRLFKAGLAERADIVLRDYRDDEGTYDGIASIEMIEAVGEKYWPTYFAALRERLRPGGIAALQVITIADRLFPLYRSRADFIQKHIFPGGMLPSPAVLRAQSTAAGLTEVGSAAFAASYARTLRLWRRSFNARWARIAALGFDQRFHRMWNFYLAASAAGFAAGATDVVQLALRRAA